MRTRLMTTLAMVASLLVSSQALALATLVSGCSKTAATRLGALTAP